MRNALRFCGMCLGAIFGVADNSSIAAARSFVVQEQVETKPAQPKTDIAPTDDAAKAAAAKQAEQNTQAIADQLLVAMDHLIPGEFPKDSSLPTSLRQAALPLLSGDLAQTKKHLEELIQSNPTLPPLQLLLGGMYFSLNQSESGRLALEQAAVDHPEYPGVYTALARLAINQGWWASSAALLAQLRQTIDAGTWSEDQRKHFESEYLDAMADTAIGQRRLDPARDYLTRLQTLVPDNASVWFRMADVDFRQSKIDSALENLAKACSFDANLYPPELVLYQWTTRRNQTEDAKRWIEAAASKFPDEKSVQLEHSRYLLEQGKLGEAADWVARAEKNNANRSITRFLRGQIAFIRRAYQVAEADFRELTLQTPNDLAARNLLALCLAESDDNAKQQTALEIANSNFRANPNSPQMASTLAWILYRMGNLQQAKQLFSQVTSLANFPSDTAFYVAQLLIEEGDDENAANLLKESLKAPGLFLYRKRAEEDLAAIEKRLAEKKDDSAKPSESKEDKR